MPNEHYAHLAYLKFDDSVQRNKVLKYLNQNGVPCSFHYVPLDNSEEGKRNAQSENVCAHSLYESNCLLRLPMHNYLTDSDIERIVRSLVTALE